MLDHILLQYPYMHLRAVRLPRMKRVKTLGDKSSCHLGNTLHIVHNDDVQ